MKINASIAGAVKAFKKPLLIMKLTLILTVFCMFQSLAHARGQMITLNMRDAEISRVLSSIEKQGSYRFLYNSRLKDLKQKVNVSFTDEQINEALTKLFNGTHLIFKQLENNLIGIRSEDPEEQDVRIAGRITSESGEALIGASILIKGTTRGTVTDNNGDFALTVPPNATLVISAVGYLPQEVRVGNQSVINLKLVQSERKLDEVVVIGYGTASKRDLTGSITKVLGKEVADKPNTNPVSSLQGKVAGLSVVNSGKPGAEPDIRIRGTISIGAVKPLYVVDGIFNDNIDYVNPMDIESIEILKDPSSLAIFGVRGASGVIIITTKKAKAGQTIVNFGSNFGFKKLVDKIAVASADQFKMLIAEEFANQGNDVSTLQLDKWKGNTDWINVLTQTGFTNNTNLSVTSATDRNRFYMGLGYTHDEGVVKHEKLDKFLISINDEYKINKAFKIGFTVNGLRQKLPHQMDIFDATGVAPIVEPYSAKLGVYSTLPNFESNVQNPLMRLESNWDKDLHYQHRMIGSVFGEINFLRYINFRATYYGDLLFGDQRSYSPIVYTFDPSSQFPDSVYKDQGYPWTTVTAKQYNAKKFQQDYILTFKKNFGDHGLTVLGGFTTYYTSYSEISGYISQKQDPVADIIPNDKRFWYLNNTFGDKATQRSNSDQYESATLSYLVRGLYNYQGKYFLNASFRRDGSSLISPANRFQNFYAVGAAWELTRENFMQTQKIFDFLKLKASWGILGNQNTGGYRYPFYPLLNTGGSTALFGTTTGVAYTQAYLPNPNLKWETVNSKEVGIELNTLNNRLHFEANYFHKLTDGLLSILPGINGAQNGLDNIGKIENKGFEFVAAWTQQMSKDFSFTVGGNLTTLKNKMVEFGNPSVGNEGQITSLQQGYPMSYFYGFVVEGIYQSYADKLGSPVFTLSDYGPGDFKFKDLNGDSIIDNKDRTVIGNPTPDFTYGISFSLNYKGFDFGVDLNGVYGNEIYRKWAFTQNAFTRFNYPAYALNRWHGAGTSNWEPILNNAHTQNNKLITTHDIEDGSYIRFRNIQVGYNFSQNLLRKTPFKSARLFANAQNLKTFKNNSGYTPEFGGSAVSFGVDYGSSPLPAIYSFGFNVTF